MLEDSYQYILIVLLSSQYEPYGVESCMWLLVYRAITRISESWHRWPQKDCQERQLCRLTLTTTPTSPRLIDQSCTLGQCLSTA